MSRGRFSSHYLEIQPSDLKISKNIRQRFENYVSVSREFLKEGYDSGGRTFHCTFAVSHGKVLSVGFNDYAHEVDYHPQLGKVKFYTDTEDYHMALHSEINAVLKMGKTDLSSVSFFNVRIDRNFECRESRPCSNCLRILKLLGAKRIYYYSDSHGDFKVIKL